MNKNAQVIILPLIKSTYAPAPLHKSGPLDTAIHGMLAICFLLLGTLLVSFIFDTDAFDVVYNFIDSALEFSQSFFYSVPLQNISFLATILIGIPLAGLIVGYVLKFTYIIYRKLK